MGAKRQKSFRLDADLLDQLDAYAECHGATSTSVVETAIAAMLDGGASSTGKEDPEPVEKERAGVGEVALLREQVSALTRMVEAEQANVRDLTATLQATQAIAALDRGAGQADGPTALQVASRMTFRQWWRSRAGRS